MIVGSIVFVQLNLPKSAPYKNGEGFGRAVFRQESVNNCSVCMEEKKQGLGRLSVIRAICLQESTS